MYDFIIQLQSYFHEAMLIFTKCFLKYHKLTCLGVQNCKKQINTTAKKYIRTFLFLANFYNKNQLRLYKNSKKRPWLEPTNNCIKLEAASQMSDQCNGPTCSHVSDGGQFRISDSELNTSSNNRREATPADFRVWEQVCKRNDTSANGNSFQFKILSYNVLAQYLLEGHPYLYTKCKPYNLKWHVRADRIFDEIVKFAPDIICLQEVQVSHLPSFYSKFEQIGYFGVFKQKTGQKQDGCAIYFKQSLFDMKDYVTVEYYQPGIPILNRDNVGVIVKLMPKNYHGPPLVIATTHLLYNPKRTDVRLAQLQVLLAEIDRIAYYSNGRECGHLPIIISGDFNSTPDSAVIKLLDRGQIRVSPYRYTSDWTKIGVTDNCQHLSVYLNRQKGLATDFYMTKIHNTDYRENTPETSTTNDAQLVHQKLFNTSVISHSLNLASTYNKYKSDGCHEATTFQDSWVTVDYIYFSYCSSLRLVERFRLPTATECEVFGRLPNDVYGSDHLVLAALFELKSCKSSI